MAKELKVSGNYVIATDLATAEVLGQFPINHCVYRENDNSFIILEQIDNEVVTISKADVDAGIWQDELAVAFTQATLLTFIRENTGFKAASGGSGVCGIADESGVYTYFESLISALSSAVSGQVVEMFADFNETGAKEVILKDGVNINMNGHTYTLDVATTESAFSITPTQNIKCTIFNGTIVRKGGTPAFQNSLALHVRSNAGFGSDIELQGVTCYSTFGLATTVTGGCTLIGGYHKSDGWHGILVYGTATGVQGYSSVNYGVYVAGGHLINSVGRSDGSNGIHAVNNCEIQGSHGYSTAGIGLSMAGGGNVAISSSGYSTANVGLRTANNKVFNCTGYSTASWGLFCSGDITNSTGYSTANIGMYASGGASGNVYNSTAISTSAPALWTNGNVYGVNAHCKWDNIAGHGIRTTSPNTIKNVFNCTIEVTNASANCLFGGIAMNTNYGQNMFKGATVPVDPNITQAQVNTQDTFGNITHG